MGGVADLSNRKILFIGGILFVALVMLIILVNIWVRRSLQDIQNQAAPPSVAVPGVEVETALAPVSPSARAPVLPTPVAGKMAGKNEEVVEIKEAPITSVILNE
ncbi:MAG: hypothetical protein ACOY3D_07430 [Candidatus Omnitrophota bacterium]